MKVDQINRENEDKGEGQKGEKMITFVLCSCALLVSSDSVSF